MHNDSFANISHQTYARGTSLEEAVEFSNLLTRAIFRYKDDLVVTIRPCWIKSYRSQFPL